MNLYTLSSEFQQLYDALDGIDLESVDGQEQLAAYLDTLEGIEGEFEEKAGNLGAMAKQLLSDAEQLDKERKAMEARAAQKKAKAQRLKEYLQCCMAGMGRTRIETPKAVITLRKNPPSVQLSNPEEFVRWAEEYRDDLLRYKEPEINKAQVRLELQSGMHLPGVSLVQTTSVTLG